MDDTDGNEAVARVSDVGWIKRKARIHQDKRWIRRDAPLSTLRCFSGNRVCVSTKKPMSEYRRAFLQGGSYFFTVVTHERRLWLTEKHAIDRLRQAFRRVMKARPFVMEAVVILPDHLHCIWRLPEGDDNFPERWRQIKRFVSVGLDGAPNARKEKALWQRRYWEHLLRDEEDWRRHVDYIHYNPVKHGYVKRPGDWPYSSFRQAEAKGWYEASWGEQAPKVIVGMEVE